jgi:acyl carrier protein
MSPDAILAKLSEVFRDVLDDDGIELTRSTSAKDVAGWDSLSHVRLVVAVEQELGIRFDAAEISGLANVGEFADVIAKKL